MGKKSIITGASRGIGKAIALGFVNEGAEVVITYREKSDLAHFIVNEIQAKGGKAKAVMLNITEVNSFDRFIEEAIMFLGEINVLVNCAGIVKRNNFLDISEEELDHIMNTNFKGNFFLTNLVAKQMKLQGKGGSIINISSISDKISHEGLSHYQASKAALTMSSKGIALELSQYNIRVNILSPGLTQTDMNKDQWEKNTEIWRQRVSQIPLGRAGTPDDYVGMAILLASDEAKYITGSHIVIDGGRSLI